ncbi:hypothetical protein BP5796_12202 [Coleophoma crateriformis]|uniref:SH3b domain-containing protein n=1 Tax=Coleophoma crateriformis TaxID=565419 RepID=A0A3D8Q8W1_9HELO|nr:hypothetical protein BP5796_12202 [Coleophoma crateriformis]
MKFTTVAITIFLPLFVLASPAPVPNAAEPTLPITLAPRAPDGLLEKRSVAATVKADGVRHRICPRVSNSCPANGQYAKGTKIRLDCYTRDNTTPVDGDYGWARITSNGDWIALAHGNYVSWSAQRPA